MLEILGKIGFDWQVALANLINFAIIFVILQYMVFKPLAKVMKERRARIDEGLNNADKADKTLSDAKSHKDELLKEAYAESQEIITDAKGRGNASVEEAKEVAVVQAQKIVDGATVQAEGILKRADSDLNKKSVDLVMSGIEKVLKSKIDSGINEQYVKEVLAK
jgi:F-type H+-transporting ATPase subunit b